MPEPTLSRIISVESEEVLVPLSVDDVDDVASATDGSID